MAEQTLAELIPIQQSNVDGGLRQTVNARDLHAFLDVKSEFRHWIKNRIDRFGFVEGIDFIAGKFLPGSDQVDYHLTISMAKELSMVERTPKGKEARLYFIECERIALSAHPPSNLDATMDRLGAFIEEFGRFVSNGMRDHGEQIGEVKSGLADVREDVAGLKGAVRSLEHTVSRISPKRRQIGAKVRAGHVHATYQLGGRCPCCGLVDLTDDGGAKLSGEFDHFYAASFPNDDHTWLICTDCHRALTTGALSRADAESRFRAYQDKRRVLPGAQLNLTALLT